MKTLYYEIHVTTDPPVDEAEAERLARVAKGLQFHQAKLFMQKGDPHNLDAFYTARTVSLADAQFLTYRFVRTLRALGVNVRRYKVEDTIVDTKEEDGDPWGLLDTAALVE